MSALPIEDYKVYNAYDKQRKFHKAVRDNEVVLFNGGRGSGKSTAGAIQSILETTQYQVGERGIIVAPTYGDLEDISMAELFKWLPSHLIRDFKKSPRPTLWLTNGSEIAFRSADNPESLRGANRAWAWLDESRNMKREAFDIVSAQLRPTRKMFLTSTPAGLHHWHYKLFIQEPIPGSAYITAKTIENPYLPRSYVDNLRAQYTGAFAAQELDAAFISFEGLIYPEFDLEFNVTTEADYNPALPVIWGVDDGYAHGQGRGTESYHPRVILLGQQTAEGGINIFAEYVRTGVADYNDTINEVLSWPYPAPDAAYIDSSAAMFKGALWNKNIFTIPQTHKVSEGIKNVRRMVCDGNGKRLIKIHPRCTETIYEFGAYRANENASAQGGELKAVKCDDHTADTLRYMCWHLRFEQN